MAAATIPAKGAAAIAVYNVWRKHVLPTQCNACNTGLAAQPASCSNGDDHVFDAQAALLQHPASSAGISLQDPPASRSDISATAAPPHFDCSICLDGCQDPVVTHCGHLFCWSCLFCWLSLHSLSQECPVCKADVQDKIIPLHERGSTEQHSPHPATAGAKVLFSCDQSSLRATSNVLLTSSPPASHYSSRRQDHGRDNLSLVPPPGSRVGNEKEFLLHWAFICAASIATVCFVVTPCS